MERALFREKQRLRSIFTWLCVLPGAVSSWYLFIDNVILGDPMNNRQASNWVYCGLLALLGIAIPIGIYLWTLITEVKKDHVRIHVWPFRLHIIPMSEIKDCYARRYRPIVEYRGRGVQYTFRNGMAYSISGNMGVQLELVDGRKVLIGSQRADELDRAIRSRLVS